VNPKTFILERGKNLPILPTLPTLFREHFARRVDLLLVQDNVSGGPMGTV
jgi:hypothetical protein